MTTVDEARAALDHEVVWGDSVEDYEAALDALIAAVRAEASDGYDIAYIRRAIAAYIGDEQSAETLRALLDALESEAIGHMHPWTPRLGDAIAKARALAATPAEDKAVRDGEEVAAEYARLEAADKP